MTVFYMECKIGLKLINPSFLLIIYVSACWNKKLVRVFWGLKKQNKKRDSDRMRSYIC